MLIARLIADTQLQETEDLSSTLTQLSDGLADKGYAVASAELLDLGAPVIEIQFSAVDPKAALEAIDALIAPGAVLISQGEIQVPALFVSDMDSTMIGQECIDELADFAGLKPQIAAITERAMQGELDFEDALRERVGLLNGLEEGAIDRCLAERIAPTPGAKTLVATLKAHGCRCVLVTGGFHHFGDQVAAWLGFDRVVGNRLGVADGKLTGQLDGPISDASTKLAVLKEEAQKLGHDIVVMSSGDGANDIPILEAADYGFAYRAKPKARDAATGRIDEGDLSNILLLLGIPRHDWVEN